MDYSYFNVENVTWTEQTSTLISDNESRIESINQSRTVIRNMGYNELLLNLSVNVKFSNSDITEHNLLSLEELLIGQVVDFNTFL